MVSSIRRLSLSVLHLLVGSALASAGPALAQSGAGIPVDVPWSGTRPDRVELRGPAASVPIDWKPAANRFQGRYPRSSGVLSFDDVILIGRWGNSDDRVLFLRISPDMQAVNLQLLRHAYTECKQDYVDPLLKQAGHREAALDAYYRARALYKMDEADLNKCRGERKKSAALAWLDRSFELAMSDCLFRLNPDAAAAYREYDQAYVAGKEQAARARALRCKQLARSHFWDRGQYAEAFAVGDQLVRELADDPGLKALASQHYAVSESTLEADQQRLGSYLAASAAWRNAPSAMAVNYPEDDPAVAAQAEPQR